MHQPVVGVGAEFDVDGYVDSKGFEYVGKAARQPDGKWRALAKIGSCLVLVECSLSIEVGPGQWEPA